MRRALGAGIAVVAVAALTVSAGARQLAPEPARPVELARYLGLWHEVARLPNWFERGCRAVTAEYSLREVGRIRVVNTCRGPGGDERRAVGRAKVVGGDGAKLKVSFFGPFWSDYWVLDRADDYSWALVGDSTRRLFWILSRSERPADVVGLAARAEALGFPRSTLEWSEPFR